VAAELQPEPEVALCGTLNHRASLWNGETVTSPRIWL
jgi:hypothetical protein